jgi:hypothetical protein
MVTLEERDPRGTRFPTTSGHEAGPVIDGAQADPDVRVKVQFSICAAFAAPGPAFIKVTVQTRALAGPDLLDTTAESKVGPATNLAVAHCGAVIAMLVSGPAPATGPAHSANEYPAFGLACRPTVEPAG